MAMQKVSIGGCDVFLDVVHHDSGENPESACTNVLIGAKVGEVTYQHLNVELAEAIGKIVASIDTAFQLDPLAGLPKMITVVVSKFHQSTTIDWKSAVSTLAMAEARGLRLA